MKNGLLRSLLLLVAITFLSNFKAWAQPIPTYGFQATTEPYVYLTGGTNIAWGNGTDDTWSNAGVTLGFAFKFGNVTYNQLWVSTNGYISFTAPPTTFSTAGNDAANVGGVAPMIFPLWDDLDMGIAASQASYSVTGATPNRVCTIEWKSLEWNWSSSANTLSMQVKLYETSNKIEFLYKQEADAGSPGGSGGASIGIADGLTGYLALDNSTAAATASSTTFATGIAAKPATNQKFIFFPPAPCAGKPNSGNVNPATVVICPGMSTTLGLVGNTIESNLTYQWQDSSSLTAGVWVDVAGATNTSITTPPVNVPTWFRMVTTCTNSSQTDTTDVQAFVALSPAPLYKPIPYVQSFESWISYCATNDKPDSAWAQDFVTGDKSWRRNDQAASAAWTNSGNGAYTPAATDGTFSARYHSYFQNGVGALRLHVDASVGSPTSKALAYDAINLSTATGLDSLKVFLSVDSGATFSQIDGIGVTSGWSPRLLNINTNSRKTIIRFEGKAAFGNTTDIGLDNVKVLPACVSMPVAGTVSPAGPVYTCIGNTHTLTAVGTSLAGGLTFTWQDSIPGVPGWNTAAGIGGNTLQFTTAAVMQDKYFRLKVRCDNTMDSSYGAIVRFILPKPKFAVIPYTQGFESWFSLCNNTDKPDSSWTQQYYSGESSWRRNDQGTNAGWANTTGAYTPVSKSGSFSARYHSFSATTPGYMLLHMDLSTVAGTKGLSYYINNTSGGDSLKVLLSTDSGVTYSLVDVFSSPSNGWYPRTVNLTSNSAKSIIKFEGSAYGGSGGNDIGIDEVTVTGPCSGAPFAGSVTPAGPISSCGGESFVFNATGTTFAGGITFQWEQSPNGTTGWVNALGGIGAATLQYTTPMVNQTTYYRLKITCGTQSSTTAAVPVFVSINPKFAVFPYQQDFETWANFCNTSDAPSDSSWRNFPQTGNPSWRRNDQGVLTAGWGSNAGAYAPTSTTGSYSARFHSFNAANNALGDFNLFINLTNGAAAKTVSYDYINVDGSDDMTLFYSNDGGSTFTNLGVNGTAGTWTNNIITLNSNAANSVFRFRARSDFGGTDIGIDNLAIVEDCAGTPNAGTAITVPAPPCKTKPFTLKLTGNIIAAGLTYQWQEFSNGLWNNIGTASANASRTYSAPANVADTAYYRCVVTCTATSLLDTSVIDTVVFNPFYQCYCDVVINATPTGNPWIDSISVSNVLTVTNTVIRASNPGVNIGTQYYQHPITPFTTDTLAMTDTAKIRLRMAGSNNKTVGMWIDLNRNGVFDAAEFKLLGTNVGTGANIILNAAYYIPDTAKRGYTGMRIMVANGITPSGTTACGATNFSSGEVEDLVVFLEYPPCSNPPYPGVASVNKVKTCPAYPIKLKVAGYQQQVTGLSFRWQISNDGTNWSYVPFATHDTATASIQFPVNYFRCEIKCYGGQASYTNNVKVTAHPDYACYCYSASADSTNSSDIGAFGFGNFMMFTPGGTHLLNPNSTEIYTDYIDNGPIVAWTDSNYKLSVYHITNDDVHKDAKVTVFIDYNRNGHYDIPQERVFTGYSTANNYNLFGTVHIPTNISVGLTGLRVVLNENINPNVPSDEGCGEYGNGETEDYLINLKSNQPAVGITEIDGVQEFSLYPNPTSGQVNIYFKAQRSEKMSLVVTNVAGQVVKEETLDVKSGDFYKTFDLTQAAKGVYFVKLSSGSKGSIIRKVVVQ